MYSTRNFTGNPNTIIEKYILPLMNSDDINLLDFKDKKNNNALHLFIKGKMKDKFGFIK